MNEGEARQLLLAAAAYIKATALRNPPEAARLVEGLRALTQSVEPAEGGVAPRHVCPVCRENDPDNLVWTDGEKVRCANCGTKEVQHEQEISSVGSAELNSSKHKGKCQAAFASASS